ncbi:hypothetical protein ACVWZA_000973 [Sphingomonas sp. UYAg733]
MMRRTPIALAALLVLSACWNGAAWFTAEQAVQAIPDGRYRLVEPGVQSPESGDTITIAQQPDHSLSITGPDNPWRAIVVPVDPALPGRFIVQLQQISAGRPDSSAGFVLLDTRAGGYRISILACAGAAREAIERSGGHVSRDPQSAASCIFADRATFLTQFRAAAQTEPAADLELRPVDR